MQEAGYKILASRISSTCILYLVNKGSKKAIRNTETILVIY